jgi:nitrogen fixation-related uncharacterized protein
MLLLPVLAAGDPAQPPKDDSVVAGPAAFAIFVVLILVIAFLGWSMVRQFKKVDRAAEEGLYDPSNRDGDRPQIPSVEQTPAEHQR